MKRILTGGALIIGFIGGSTSFIESIAVPTPIVYAREAEEPQEVQIEVKVDWSPERIDQEIVNQAERYGVSADVMRTVIDCESSGSTTIQSHHRRPDGTREQSFGLSQIHLPDHPTVSYEEAIDPEFAIDFMAKAMASGDAWMWTCYRMHY